MRSTGGVCCVERIALDGLKAGDKIPGSKYFRGFVASAVIQFVCKTALSGGLLPASNVCILSGIGGMARRDDVYTPNGSASGAQLEHFQ